MSAISHVETLGVADDSKLNRQNISKAFMLMSYFSMWISSQSEYFRSVYNNFVLLKTELVSYHIPIQEDELNRSEILVMI